MIREITNHLFKRLTSLLKVRVKLSCVNLTLKSIPIVGMYVLLFEKTPSQCFSRADVLPLFEPPMSKTLIRFDGGTSSSSPRMLILHGVC